MKETYLLHSKLKIHRWRINNSKRLIAKALENSSKPYVACSFGKDSLVMLHLVQEQCPGIDVIWIREKEYGEWPDTERIALEYDRKYSINLHPMMSMDVSECYRIAGGFYVFTETEKQKEADRLYEKAFIRAITSKAEELGCDLAFIGLRIKESKKRRILLKSRGCLFYAKSHRINECFPMAEWEARDIWAYIFEHELPYPNLYDLADDREKARNGAMFAANIPMMGGVSIYNGQLAMLKKMYPDLFNRFAAEFPEVRLYI